MSVAENAPRTRHHNNGESRLGGLDAAVIYVAVGDLISEIAKTDITIASVIINVPTAFVHDLAERNITQSIYVSAFR